MKKLKNWSNVEDIIVAETMLKQLKEGSRQIDAFKKLSKKLDRSSKSIEMHWYKIKPNYQSTIDKIQNDLLVLMEEKHGYIEGNLFGNIPSIRQTEPEVTQSVEPLNIDSVINFLKENKEVFSNIKELEDLKKENARLQLEANEVKKLKLEIKELKEEKEQLKEDYRAFASVMNKAREIFQDEKDKPRTVYKTLVNGTVEVGK